MLTYEPVPTGHEIHERLDRLVAANHPDLAEARATINAIFVYGGLKLHGYPCLATIKINSLKDRVEGKSDATLSIDGDSYSAWTDGSTDATLDHECQHLTVLRDDEGAIKEDDHGRPKLKIRLHDLVVGGFAVIAERHGDAAPEVQAIHTIQAEHEQLRWDWGEDRGTKKARKPAPSPRLADPPGPALIEDTFRALLSVGHTESQARAAIDRVVEGDARWQSKYKSVSDLIDAIYQENIKSGPVLATGTA